jgi:hypothetical protein
LPLTAAPNTAKQTEAEIKESGKGWKYTDHSPVAADPIIGDIVKANVTPNGKRSRKPPKDVYQATPAPAPAPKSKATATRSQKTALIIQPDSNSDDKQSVPVPKRGRGRPRNVLPPTIEPDADHEATQAGRMTASRIRGDIVELVSQSLQVAENVAEFMRGTDEVEEGEQMDADGEEAVRDRGRKRKAKAKEREGSEEG